MDLETKSNQIETENVKLKEDYSCLLKEKGLLEKKCSNVRKSCD